MKVKYYGPITLTHLEEKYTESVRWAP